jgi:glycosyltransferase involved in cell wall biosynthesis
MPKLSASVVLCTYQGERFLPEQLASLRAQTRAPLEILAQDDASPDGTFALLETEQRRTPGTFRALRNEARLGFAANFARAFAQARGDVIFFCDQDDVWEPEKIATLLERFEADPGLKVACSEATKIDEGGRPLPGLVLEGNFLGVREREEWGRPGGAFPQLARKNAVPGMTMAVRAALRDAVLPIPPAWEHDYWILVVAAGLGERIYVEPRPLVRYRQHTGQVIGGSKTFGQRWRRAEGQTIAGRRAEAERWLAVGERIGTSAAAPLVEGKREHLRRRGGFSSVRALRAAQIAGELLRGGYHQFDSGWSSALKDLLSS